MDHVYASAAARYQTYKQQRPLEWQVEAEKPIHIPQEIWLNK